MPTRDLATAGAGAVSDKRGPNARGVRVWQRVRGCVYEFSRLPGVSYRASTPLTSDQNTRGYRDVAKHRAQGAGVPAQPSSVRRAAWGTDGARTLG